MKLLVTNIVLHVLDFLTTLYGVFIWKLAPEINPLIFNVEMLIGLKVVAIFCLLFYHKNRYCCKEYKWVMGLLAIVYGWVVLDNGFIILQTFF